MNKTLVQELKGAVKAMNKVLKDNEEPLIKVVGVKRDTIMDKFFETISSYVEDKRTEEIPEVAIDFYNKVVEEADEGGEAEPTEKKSRKRSTAKAKANKPAGKKDTGKKNRGTISDEIIKIMIKNDNNTDIDFVYGKLKKVFPDRGDNMKSTVAHVLRVMKVYFRNV